MVRRPSEIFHVMDNGHGWQVLFQPHHEDGHDKLSGTHRESVRKGGKDGVVLDRAPWHTSAAAKEFFESHDIIIVWYPVGHPYLNPVEEVWSVLKRAVVHSVRYADTAAHLTAVYGFIGNHEFDYCFFKFWKQKPSEGVMRPFVRSDGQLDHAIENLRVNSAKKRCRCKKR